MVRVRDANGAEAPLLQGDGKHALLPDDDNHPFWVGPALSVYQNAGGPNTNWSEYETHRNHLGQPVIEASAKLLFLLLAAWQSLAAYLFAAYMTVSQLVWLQH